jgi:hypothetical protein
LSFEIISFEKECLREMKPILGIMLGEAAGIGPEIVAKLVA